MPKSKFNILLICFGLFLMFQGCKVAYSFTGASIDQNIKTVTVPFFQNRARLVEPSLSGTFTEMLQDKFVTETNLNLVDRDGDLQFSGAIIGYTETPAGSSTNEIATLNRLTITIRVEYINTVSGEKWEENFTQFQDFENTLNLKDVEDQLIDDICTVLVNDIFNRALVNW